MTKNKNQCAGTYPVSGYTREDGTKVSGYQRTCGAKHLDDDLVNNLVASYLAHHFNNSAKSKENYDGITGGAAGILESDENDYDKQFLLKGYLNNNDFEYHHQDIPYTNLAQFQKALAKYLKSDKIFYEYYNLSLYFDEQTQYNKNNSFVKFGDLKEDDIKEYIRNSFWKYGITDSTDVVIAQYNSPLKKEIVSSSEFKKLVENNYLSILNNEYLNKTLQLNFSETTSLWLTLGKTQLYSPHFDEFGNFVATLIDYYDFDYIKDKDKKDYNIYSKLVKIINNNAYVQQEAGELRNYILAVPIVLFNYKGSD